MPPLVAPFMPFMPFMPLPTPFKPFMPFSILGSFGATGAPLWGPTPVLVCAGVMVLVVIVQIARAPRTMPASGDGWRGLFYVNPSDPRLVVPKRWGIGWTFNFARPVAWVVLAALLLGPLLVVAVVMLRAVTHR